MFLGRRSRKNKTRYYSGGVVVLILLVGILVGLFFYLSPDRKVDRYLGRARALPQDDRRREPYLEKAAIIYETKLARNPSGLESLLGLANVYAVLGRYDEAIANYQEALAYDDGSKFSGRDYYQLGVAYLRKGIGSDPEEALRFLQLASENGYLGDDAEIAFKLGKIYKDDKMYPEALVHYRRGMELGGSSVEAHYILGWLFYNEGSFERAATQYKKAADSDPNFAEAHYWLGKVYDKMNRKSEAVFEWEESLKVDPNHQYARYAKEKLKGK